MTRVRVRPAKAPEADAVAATLVAAFERDPFAQWLFQDGAIRRSTHRQLFAKMIADPVTIVDVTDDLDAAALWLPPASSIDFGAPPGVSDDANRLFELERKVKKPSAYWYLAFLGARSPRTGAGSALLAHRLSKIEGQAALFTGNEANVAFYERFGFALQARCDVPGASGWWMVRGEPCRRVHS